MKTRMFVSILILNVTVLIILGNCATKQKAISEKEAKDALVGTWINPEYLATSRYRQKRVFTTEGKAIWYNKVTSKEPMLQQNYTIVESWRDRKGDIWYKLIVGFATDRFKYLAKINISENTFEYLELGGARFPTEIDPTHVNYRIYYRQ